MAGARVELNGAREAIEALRFYQVDKKARVRTVIATFGLLIESEAKRLAPVDTGRLRASIHLELRSDGLGGEVATNLTYAPIIELGGRNRRAQPFLFPAAEKYRNAFAQAITDALRTR
jgi:hypothetical protein